MQDRKHCNFFANPITFLLTAKSLQSNAKGLHQRSLKWDYRVCRFAEDFVDFLKVSGNSAEL